MLVLAATLKLVSQMLTFESPHFVCLYHMLDFFNHFTATQIFLLYAKKIYEPIWPILLIFLLFFV